jgi:hypothetical protein
MRKTLEMSLRIFCFGGLWFDNVSALGFLIAASFLNFYFIFMGVIGECFVITRGHQYQIFYDITSYQYQYQYHGPKIDICIGFPIKFRGWGPIKKLIAEI